MKTREHAIARELRDFNLWSAAIIFVAIAAMLFAPAVLAQDDVNPTGKKIKIKARYDKAGQSKALDSTRSRSKTKSTSVKPANWSPIPTDLQLEFPTIVYPGDTVEGQLHFNDDDDYIFSIFITVIYPDGDVVTTPLYDYREEGGDIWTGTITFWVDIPMSETPIPGNIIITCSDEYLNISQVTRNFVLDF